MIILKYPEILPLVPPSLSLPSGKSCIINRYVPAPVDYADLVFSPQEMPVTHSVCGKCRMHSQLTCVSAAEKAGIPRTKGYKQCCVVGAV